MTRQAEGWKVLGSTEPYFAVLTDRRFHDADRPGPSREAFFRTGEDDIAKLFERITAEYPSFAPRRALDFGCGVGRLLLPLARRVPEVVGVDISPAMLAEARRNATEAGLSNVTLLSSDAPEYRRAGAFDLVHSHIVFQHIPRREGLRIVRDLLDRLSRGGVGALHFVYAIRRPPWWRAAHWARKTIPGVHRAANVVRGHPAARPLMQMNAYPLAALYAMIHDCGASRLSSHLVDHDGFLGATLIFQKPL
ncbi:MAG TPA: methyltransferase domain-containing protein [Gammaproteobacteria bacterium]